MIGAKAREDMAAIEKGSVDNGPGAVMEFQENSPQTGAAKIKVRKCKNRSTKGHRERTTRRFILKYDDIVH